jgi:prephenate dehydrogenase (NADP+)
MSQLFRLWLGVTEYLFRNQDLLDEALDTAIDDNTFRSDDLEFTFAARVCSSQQLMNDVSKFAYANGRTRHGLTVFPSATLSRTVTVSSALQSTLRRVSLKLLLLVMR